MACGILVPRLGIEPMSPAVEARSPNHWTTREVPGRNFLKRKGRRETEFQFLTTYPLGIVLPSPWYQLKDDKRRRKN